MKVLCVSHFPREGLGTVGDVLKARAAEVEHVYAHEFDMTGVKPDDHDVAIFMGGPMGVYQADIFPWIDDEIAYLKARMEKDLPTLGICLGSQLMAAALGQTVVKGNNGSELGWKYVDITPEGLSSPVRHFEGVRLVQWHGDTYDLPEGAVHLASSAQYAVQAYRYKKRSMAVQFHPEVTENSAEDWIVGGDFSAIEKHLGGVAAYRAQIKENAPHLVRAMTLFMNEWLESLNA